MRNLILCGFMGSGKTAVGKLLAERLQMKFFDTDEIIVNKMGMSISEIFERYKEPYFRELETQTIIEFENTDNAVISLGGGLAVNSVNHPYLKKAGTVILLDCGIEETLRRISGDSSRPLTAGGEEDIINRYNLRKPIYEEVADIRVNSSKSPEETYKSVIQALEDLNQI